LKYSEWKPLAESVNRPVTVMSQGSRQPRPAP